MKYESSEFEINVLSALLTNNKVYDKISDKLHYKHFSNELCAEIYKKSCEFIENGKSADPLTLGEVGFPMDKTMSIVNARVSTINILDYTAIIIDNYKKRRLLEITNNEQLESSLEESSVSKVIGETIGLIEDVNEDGQDVEIKSMNSDSKEHLERIQKAIDGDYKFDGVETQFKDVDELINGFGKGHLIYLGGRPAMGKTTWALNSAIKQVKKGFKPVFFSLEMTSSELQARALSGEVNIPMEDIKHGRLDSQQFARIIEARRYLDTLPMVVVDRPNMTINNIRVVCKRLKRQGRLDIVYIDYLQLIDIVGTYKGNRVAEVTELSRKLKMLAKELNVPVVVLSQLSRGVEQRDNKRPIMSDLRESGGLEQDADLIGFFYRAEYYLQQCEPENDTDDHVSWENKLEQNQGKGEIIIAKNRHGSSGRVEMVFNGSTCSFNDLEWRY